ncbi:5-hydroxytryptamine receptor 3A-like [Mixophyes fleayi]|uniref:5-hydroxytryptamine receptor 3A-like n=1 Tax=Mixophyes fleayi TaxID=3061075 RepID=UPI003F4E21EC
MDSHFTPSMIATYVTIITGQKIFNSPYRLDPVTKSDVHNVGEYQESFQLDTALTTRFDPMFFFKKQQNNTCSFNYGLSTDTVSDCIKEDSKDNKESAEVALPVTEKFKLLTSILKEIVSIKDQVKNITDQTKESPGLKTNKSTTVGLLEHLMDGYNKGVRPVKNWRKPTTVYIEISIYTILGVDEKNQIMKTYIWYNQSWVDEFLKWDPTQFDNLTQFSLPTQSIWLPDIMIEEAVGPRESPDVPYVYVNYRGRILNTNPMQITTSCNLNIYFFPFDILNCSLSFSSWLHSTQDINISFWRIPQDLNSLKNPSVTEGEWDLINVVPSYREFTDHEDKFGKITFYIILRRKPLFYTVNLIFPSVLLMIMDMIGFYLPPESGERISFKITLLLGYSVFLIIVSDTLPASGAPLIGIYFVLCMLLLMVSLAESILIVKLIHQRNSSPEVPKWLKKVVLEKMTILLCIKDKWEPGTSCNSNSGISWPTENNSTEKLSDYKNGKSNDSYLPAQEMLAQTKYLEALDRIVKAVESIRENQQKTDDQDICKEWLHVAYVLDTFLFRAYFALVITYTFTMIFLWSY